MKRDNDCSRNERDSGRKQLTRGKKNQAKISICYTLLVIYRESKGAGWIKSEGGKTKQNKTTTTTTTTTMKQTNNNKIPTPKPA